MGGHETSKTEVCSLGFDEDRMTMTLPDLAADEAAILERYVLILGPGKSDGPLYCRGHRFLKQDVLADADPFYEERGMSVDGDGITRNLHGAPSCYGCRYTMRLTHMVPSTRPDDRFNRMD